MKILQSLVKITSEIGAVEKTGWNAAQKYKFRGIDAVYAALQPLLVKYNVAVIPEVLEEHYSEKASSSGTIMIYRTLKVRYTFYNSEDQSSISAIVIGEGMDSGDKASNKAMSAAHKYAILQVFCIPSDQLKDSEDDSHSIAGNTSGKIYNKENSYEKFSFVAACKSAGIIDPIKISELSEAFHGKSMNDLKNYLEKSKK